MATRESMTDEQWGKKLQVAYDKYAENHANGLLADDAMAPHEVVNILTRSNREAREGAAGRDDSQPTKSANGNRGNGGAEPSLDEGGLGPVENQNKTMDEAAGRRWLEARSKAQDRKRDKHALENAAADSSINPARAHQLLKVARHDLRAAADTLKLIPGIDRLG